MGPDTILVNVPRLVEVEPGFQMSALLADYPDEVKVSTGDLADGSTEPAAAVETLTRRWMGRPVALVDDFAGVAAWSATGTTLIGTRPRALQGLGNERGDDFGIEVTEEPASVDTPWRVETAEPLVPRRGLIVSILPYEPDQVQHEAPLRIIVGDKWKIELLPPIRGQAAVVVYDRDLEEPSRWSEDAVPIGQVPGAFYGETLRLWIQPLAGDEVLIRGLDDPLIGDVVRTKRPLKWQPPADDPEGEPPPAVDVPWGAAPLAVEGVARCMVVAAYALFPATWRLEAAEASEIGYTPSVVPTISAETYLPSSEYSATFEVTTPEGEDYLDEETAGNSFVWSVDVAGPADHSYGGRDYSYLAATVDRLQIEWPLTLESDGLSAVDLAEQDEVVVTDIGESRTVDDATATLTVTIDGPQATIAPWLRPNARWQWKITGADPEIRFDGLRDGLRNVVYLSDGVHYNRATVTLRNRWRQLDRVMYRGSVPLDGLKRSEVYRRVAKAMPLDDTELSIAEDLVADANLPGTRAGEPPAWLPRVGTTLSQVLRDIHEGFGFDDRLWFRGETFTVEPRDLETPVATFVRHPDDEEGATVEPALLIAGVWDGMFVEATNDDDFINDLWVQGRDADTGGDLSAFHVAPSSWQVPGSEHYVGQRRTLVVTKPELTNEDAVKDWGLNLWRKFHRFIYLASVTGPFAPDVYPGQVALIDPGDDPDAKLSLVEIVSMNTRLVANGESEVERRYDTAYELRLVTEEYVPPEEPEE